MSRQRAITPERYWAILPDRFQMLIDAASTAEPLQFSLPDGPAGIQYELADGVAIIDVAGVLSKCGSWLDRLFGTGSAMIDIGAAIVAAAADDDVNAILLRVDSPGGTVRGTGDLAAIVAAANLLKPVTAYIEDLGASAAYWIASQAGKIYSNPTAVVGSIGTYAILYDSSKMADSVGVAVRVVRAGEYKGTGVPGTEITDDQLADEQRMVDALNAHFLAGVAKGRRMSPAAVEQIADGRVHIGPDAQALGLTDGVCTFAEALAELQALGRPAQPGTARPLSTAPGPFGQSAAEPPVQSADDVARVRGQEADRLARVKEHNAAYFAQEVRDLMREGKSRGHAERLAAIRLPDGAEAYRELHGAADRPAAAESKSDVLAEFMRELRERTNQGIPRQNALRELRRAKPKLYSRYMESIR